MLRNDFEFNTTHSTYKIQNYLSYDQTISIF